MAGIKAETRRRSAYIAYKWYVDVALGEKKNDEVEELPPHSIMQACKITS